MERKEAYEQIKKLGLQEVCKKMYGKNFTQCKTTELEETIHKAKIKAKIKVNNKINYINAVQPTTKTCKTNKNTLKYMAASGARTIRDLVKIANDQNIQKEDIVTVMKEVDQYLIIYYRN